MSAQEQNVPYDGPSLLECFADGACCTVVLAKATPDRLARCFGEPVAVAAGEKGRVAALANSAWSWISLADGYLGEGKSLLQEACLAAKGEISTGPACYEHPIAVAGKLSQQIGVAAIAIWGSDQGEGIVGLAELADGQLTRVITPASPAQLAQLLVEQLTLDDEQHYCWPAEKMMPGNCENICDGYLHRLGFDLETLLETPLDPQTIARLMAVGRLSEAVGIG